MNELKGNKDNKKNLRGTCVLLALLGSAFAVASPGDASLGDSVRYFVMAFITFF